MHHAIVGAKNLAGSDMDMKKACEYKFTRQQKLRESAQFQTVFNQTDCKAIDDCFVVLAKRRPDHEARLGMAISKRRIRHAVGRNRIKRLVRESFRHHQHLLTGLDIVVMERLGTSARENAELVNALRQLWVRLAKKCKSC